MTETLEHHIVSDRLLVLDQVVHLAFSLHHKRVGGLADLALERLPEEGGEVL